MSNLRSFAQSVKNRNAKLRVEFLRKFGRDEDGSIIVLTILLLIMMLVLGGMAVDFMRFESRRSLLQSVSDRAVLAAAELDQTLEPKAVVIDYFAKAGFDGTIVGEPTAGKVGTTRTVSVNAQLDIDTFYLRLIGIDQLEAPAQSAATEGVGNVEISLVVDISGSMYDEVTGVSIPSKSACLGVPTEEITFVDGTRRKIEILQEAACSFVNELITPDYKDQVSISLVAYSEQVNIGPSIFNAIKTTNPTIVDPAPADGSTPASFTNPALCVEIPQTHYDDTAFVASHTFEQTESWQSNQHGFGGWAGTAGTRDYRIGDLDQPLCPNAVAERIVPISQSSSDLRTAISGLRPRGGTSIFMGLRWGVTLLDPTFQSTIQALPIGDVSSKFRTTRPSEYPGAVMPDGTTNNINTVKYVVLMTDGQNSDSNRIADEYYNTAEYQELWNTYNYPYMWYHANYRSSTLGNQLRALDTNPFTGDYGTVRDGLISSSVAYSEDDGDRLMQAMCDAAKARNITIFTIAMAAEAHGQEEMEECASEPSENFYFETSGKELVAIFGEIADQITDLRLSL